MQLKAYANLTINRYQRMSKAEKSRHLKEVCEDLGCHRNSLIRAYARIRHKRSKPRKRALKAGRKPEYHDDAVIWWLQTLWVCMGEVNEKLMKAMLPTWIAKNKDSNFPQWVQAKILKMSSATIGRILAPYVKANKKKLYATTRRGRMKGLQNKIPIRPLDNKISQCGYTEGDCVAHCGNSLEGSFAWTLNCIDPHSDWCEEQACLGKTEEKIKAALIQIRDRFPYDMKGFHSDQGTEFINKLIYEYFTQINKPVIQSMGRAYKKNDQSRVEQSNWSRVRQNFGYERISTQNLVEMMNDIYANELRLLNNFFTATRKQKSKTRIGAKYKYTYHPPMTPFERVMADKSVSIEIRNKLQKIFDSLDPFELKKRLDQKMKFFKKALLQSQKPTEIEKVPSVGSLVRKKA